jgi:regulator of nucleoside diphosphate kinase
MKSSREPPIVIVKNDFERLRGFASATNLSPAADYLASELERACVVETMPDIPVVRLGSRVRFKDSGSAAVRDVTVVMPNEADISAARISVLTPVGAALLGLSAGQQITFTLPNGSERSLHVLAISNP